MIPARCPICDRLLSENEIIHGRCEPVARKLAKPSRTAGNLYVALTIAVWAGAFTLWGLGFHA